MRVPWTARRSNQSILKEMSPGCSLEGLMLRLKLQYFGHLMRRVDSLEKTLMLGGIGGRRRRVYHVTSVQFSSVQLLSRVRLCDPMNCSTPGSLLKRLFIESVMPFNYLMLCHLHLLLPSIFSSIRVFSNKSVLLIRWPKYWSFSFSPCNEYSGLISCRIDLFDLLAVQGTLKSLLQHCSSKASILQCSAVFIVQLSHP